MTRRLSFYLLLSMLFAGLFSCQKEFKIDGMVSGGPQGPAYYNYDGAPGACATAVVAGNYYAGVPLDSSNKVTIVVTVRETGHYTVSTNTANGFKFEGSGIFYTTGVQTLKLYGVGTPTATGATVFTPENNGCSFSVTVGNTPTPPSGYFLKFNANGTLVEYTDTCGAQQVGNRFGIAAAANKNDLSANIFYIDLLGSTSAPTTGSYQEQNAVPTATVYAEALYKIDAAHTWFIDSNAPTATPNPNPFKVTITYIDATRVQGTFSGYLWDGNTGSPDPMVVTAGEFNAARE